MSHARRVSVGILALGSLLLIQVATFPGAAQTEQAYFRVNLAIADAKVTIEEVSGSKEVEAVISMSCLEDADSYGPCTGPLATTPIDVELIVEAPPAGWSTNPSTSSFRMPANEERRTRITIKLLQDEPDADSFGMRVRATATPDHPLPAFSQPSQASDVVTVEKKLTVAQKVVNFTGAYAPWLLGAAGLAIVGIVLLARKKKGRLLLMSDAPQQTVLPGRGASFPVRIENEARDPDRVRLGVGQLPQGWAAIIPLDEIDLRPNEQTQLWVTVRCPPRALPGDVVNFDLRASSLGGSQREARVPLRVEVSGGSALASPAIETPPEESLEASSEPAEPKKLVALKRTRR